MLCHSFFDMFKKILFTLITVLSLCNPTVGRAQPSLSTISGTIYKPTGAVCGNCTFQIVKSRKGGFVLSSNAVTITANSSGVVSFTAVRGSIITITGNFLLGNTVFTTPRDLYVPDEVSAVFSSLRLVEDYLDQIIGSVPTGTAPDNALYILKNSDARLSGSQSLGLLSTGVLKNNVSSGIGTLSTAVGGTDYEFPLTFAARLSRSVNTIDLGLSGVTANSYTAPTLTIDQYGRVTAAASVSYEAPLTFSAPLSRSVNTISIPNGITGTGTSGTIPKFSGTNTVANSILTESNNTITAAGGYADAVVTYTTSGNTVQTTSATILLDATAVSSPPMLVLLPSVSGIPVGRKFTFVRIDYDVAKRISIISEENQPINGVSRVRAITVPMTAHVFQSTATGWRIISEQ